MTKVLTKCKDNHAHWKGKKCHQCDPLFQHRGDLKEKRKTLVLKEYQDYLKKQDKTWVSEREKEQISILNAGGFSANRIAARLKRTVWTINKYLKKVK